MPEQSYSSKTLDDIRKRIDELDTRIHDTLMERAELVLKVGEEKRRNNIQIVQPAREARMIRRLLSRHGGVLPEMAVVRIWRELVGAVSLLQTGLKVSVSVPDGEHVYWDLARDYFGSCLPMQAVSSPLGAIAAVRENKATFAVVPWPEDEETQPWWTFLLDETDDAMKISIRLPHGDDPNEPNPDNRALVVSKTGFGESGEDRSFLLIECMSNVSRGKLVDVAEKLGLKALSLSSRRNTADGAPSLHLMEVDGYIAQDQDILKQMAEMLEDSAVRVICAGGYPVPLVYAKTIVPKDSDIPVAPPEKETV